MPKCLGELDLHTRTAFSALHDSMPLPPARPEFFTKAPMLRASSWLCYRPCDCRCPCLLLGPESPSRAAKAVPFPTSGEHPWAHQLCPDSQNAGATDKPSGLSPRPVRGCTAEDCCGFHGVHQPQTQGSDTIHKIRPLLPHDATRYSSTCGRPQESMHI